jgi:glutamate decarboxylase
LYLGYFDVEEKYVYCTENRFVLDPEAAVELIDENTIGICVILGSTFNGEYEYADQPSPSKLDLTNT